MVGVGYPAALRGCSPPGGPREKMTAESGGNGCQAPRGPRPSVSERPSCEMGEQRKGVEMGAAKTTLKPVLRFRVWREAEQRWYTEQELTRKPIWDRFVRRVLEHGEPRGN